MIWLGTVQRGGEMVWWDAISQVLCCFFRAFWKDDSVNLFRLCDVPVAWARVIASKKRRAGRPIQTGVLPQVKQERTTAACKCQVKPGQGKKHASKQNRSKKVSKERAWCASQTSSYDSWEAFQRRHRRTKNSLTLLWFHWAIPEPAYKWPCSQVHLGCGAIAI